LLLDLLASLPESGMIISSVGIVTLLLGLLDEQDVSDRFTG
jgi:hypothetical protein